MQNPNPLELGRKEDQGAVLYQGAAAKAHAFVKSEWRPLIKHPHVLGIPSSSENTAVSLQLERQPHTFNCWGQIIFLGVGHMDSNRYLTSGSARPTKRLKWTHTVPQHVMGFSARKSNSLPHLLCLSFKDQSCAHSWSLCESCLIN